MQLQGLIETPEQSSMKFKPALADGPEDGSHGQASDCAIIGSHNVTNTIIGYN